MPSLLTAKTLKPHIEDYVGRLKNSISKLQTKLEEVEEVLEDPVRAEHEIREILDEIASISDELRRVFDMFPSPF